MINTSKVDNITCTYKEESGATARVAGVRKRVILRRPALKALPNLSLNVSDTLRATRAK